VRYTLATAYPPTSTQHIAHCRAIWCRHPRRASNTANPYLASNYRLRPSDITMSTAVALQSPMPRPTPVPIAAAKPRKQKPSPGKDNLVSIKPISSTVGPVANIRTRRERPCDACRRRKSRCVIQEGAVLCVLCDFHKQECTFVQSPLPRKRKVVDDGKKDSPNNQKKRCVQNIPPTSHPVTTTLALEKYGHTAPLCLSLSHVIHLYLLSTSSEIRRTCRSCSCLAVGLIPVLWSPSLSPAVACRPKWISRSFPNG